ncbi:MAG: DUF1080 domain-containing protein [Opitutus sp.]
MKTPVPLLILFSCVTLSAFAANDANALSSAEKADGWKLLFDGSTLNGWRGYAATTPGAGWQVVDGSLTLKGKGGDLLTANEYGDFDLSFEWKVTEAANSGVIYRVGLGEAASYTTGPEYQVLDNDKASDNKKYNHLAGSLYDVALEPAATVKPVGEWNSGRIRVRGWHVEHWLNGKQVVDVDMHTPKGKALIAESKFKDWAKFASLSRGYIAFQDHGHEVSFRSIKIRDAK